MFDWGGTLSTFATSVRVQELWNPAAAALEPHTTHSHEEIAACLAATEDAFWERTATHQRAGTLADIVAEAHERLGADVPGRRARRGRARLPRRVGAAHRARHRDRVDDRGAGADINYEGAATPIDWNAAGDVTSGFMEIYGYRDGALVTIEVQPFSLE